jgi:secondary thiamine-phosphate synthase enzyme
MLFKYSIKTNSREEMIDITNYVEESVKKANVKEGIAIIFTPHTTSAITINENADPSVRRDIIAFLKDRIPRDYPFTHLEGNSDAHIKSSTFGCSLTIIITNGELLLGTWQGIYFCEFDGPRHRNFYVKVIEG